VILDKAGATPNPMIRLKLIKELGQLRRDIIVTQENGGPLAAINRLKLLKQMNQIRTELGAGEVAKLTDNMNPDDADVRPRPETAALYEFDERMTKGKRQKANNTAIDLVAKIKAGDVSADELTDEQKKTLASYTGNGGGLIGQDGKKGSAYEYYTPVPVAAGIWDAMAEMGFSGGKVLDPSAGTGIFGSTAPRTAAVDAVELDETSGAINQLLNDGQGYSTTVAPFEKVAAATDDEIYDAVVTNVPFGTVADRGGNQLHDPRYQKETLETYFILRSLEKLKPGGLAAFIVPPRCTSGRGANEVRLRERASYLGEFLGAYRLPNKVFGEAAADTITDVIFLRKHSTEARQKIEELQQDNAESLSTFNVLWDDYIEGRYFESEEGRIRVLGEFKAKDPDKFRDVDRVESPNSVPEIAKMLRKLPGTRIDWVGLDAAETMPVEYSEGDTIHHGGQTLEWRDGKWSALKQRGESEIAAKVLSQVKDAYTAYHAGIVLDSVLPTVNYLRQASKALDIPDWLTQTIASLNKLPEGGRADAWLPCVTAAAMVQVLNENGRDSGMNFREEFRSLSDSMQKYAARAKKLRSKVGGYAKSALSEMAVHYQPKKGFSNLWLGEVAQTTAFEISSDAGFEGLKYKAQGHFVDIEGARALYSDGFDPMSSDDWCVSADGKQVAKADDYYTGNYAQFLSVIDLQIEQAASEELKNKLIRQKLLAEERVDRLDPGSITHNLFSPYVTIEEKVDFLRSYVHPTAFVDYDANGKKQIGFDIPNSELSDRTKLIKRMSHYMNHRSITLGGVKLSISDETAIKELQGMVRKANEQFSGWAKANRSIKDRMASRLNEPERLYFRQVEDEAPLSVPGLNPDFQPHGYQNGFARSMGRDFSGINGFGTGLGKTFSALLSVQYVQSIGVKNKTLFVVPGSVLSNWRKETAAAYANIDDCLFVGLREDANGGFTVDSKNYDEDLFSVMENKHRKIFMTMEAFERLRLKEPTIENFEKYMRSVDASFGESEDKKKDEKSKSKAKALVSVLASKTGAAPYIEDMGIDSIVIDEAHAFKNSAETVEFTGAKYLSVSESSKRGMDAQAKCWFIRGLTPRGDGVLSLSATPLTNSPLEIYSMLSLASGHQRVNDMLGGIQGADAFMNAVCEIEDEEDLTLDGKSVSMSVFKGLNNSAMLRRALHQVATIKDADDVGAQIFVPEADEKPTPVSLTNESFKRLETYKDAYRYAMDTLRDKSDPGGSPEALEAVKNLFGETDELVGHPFNLINKMNYLIADPDLDKRQTRYTVALEADREKLITAWNAKKHSEERAYKGPNSTDADVLSSKVKKNKDGDTDGMTFKMMVRAWSEGNQVCLDTMDVGLQDKFEAIADKAGIELGVEIPPKLAAMLKNFQTEQSRPRGKVAGKPVKYTKQIIFCDILSWHNKIKRLLMQRAGLRADQIVIVTGKKNNAPEDILDVQNEFNAEDGKYRVVIANKKAEVGINLQLGTQAIHHLTIGWTPDSLKQRNGRGVRQGNSTGKVSIYHYDANGTFDEAKRTLVASKADWIDSLMDDNGGDRIEISGGMSREKMEALIDVFGDDDGVAKMQAAMAEKEAEARIKASRDKQQIAIDTIETQNGFLSRYGEMQGWIGRYLGDYLTLRQSISDIRKRLEKTKSANRAAQLEMRIAETQASMEGIKSRIEAAGSIQEARDYSKQDWDDVSVESVIASFTSRAKRGESSGDHLARQFANGNISYKYLRFISNDDSELLNEWMSEVDMAKELRQNAVDAYEVRAKEDGRTPAGAAVAIADGRGTVYGDIPLFDGVLVTLPQRTSDDLSVVIYKDNRLFGLWSGATAIRGFTLGNIMTNSDARVVYPGTSEYDDLIAAMAAHDDEWATKGEVDSVFTDLVPEVSELRTTSTPVAYTDSRFHGGAHYYLPAPYFPVPINSDFKGTSDFLDSIIEKQSEVIIRWERTKFIVPQDLTVKESESVQPLSVFIAYAQANNLKLKNVDFGPFRSTVDSYISSKIDNANLKEILAEADRTKEAIIEAAKRFIRETADWYDAEGNEFDALTYQESLIDREISSLSDGAPSEGEPSEVTEDLNALVSVTGETRRWKDEIKEYARKYEASGYAKWNRREVAWKMKIGAFKLLEKELPQAAAQLEYKLV
jgi:SNF2 family DNA or RNA helicase